MPYIYHVEPCLIVVLLFREIYSLGVLPLIYRTTQILFLTFINFIIFILSFNEALTPKQAIFC